MSINYPTLAHFRYLSRFRHSFNYTVFPIHSIMQNKPNLPHFSPENDDLRKNKPNSNPIQTQFKPIQTQFKPIQSQNKPNSERNASPEKDRSIFKSKMRVDLVDLREAIDKMEKIYLREALLER